MPNYQDLQAQIASLQAQAEEMRQQEIAEVIQEIKEKIALYTLKAEDLGFRPCNARALQRNRHWLQNIKIRKPERPGAGTAERQNGFRASQRRSSWFLSE